jgi:hypothetical protein
MKAFSFQLPAPNHEVPRAARILVASVASSRQQGCEDFSGFSAGARTTRLRWRLVGGSWKVL